jgi:transcriptional regulator with XRE-family HTH domain
VAASIRAFFKANISRILDELRDAGVKHAAVAKAFGVDPTVISQLKSGAFYPSPERLDDLVEALNKVRPKDFPPYEHEDLARDPAKQSRATGTLLEELARQAGYEIVRKSPR